MLIIRPSQISDLPSLIELARLSGSGFTSLPDDEAQLLITLEQAEASLHAKVTEPGSERYFLMLEDSDTGQILGCAGLKATVGIDKPFFNFRRFNIAQVSAAAKRRFDLDILLLVNEFRGATEVGSLFLRPEGRGRGAGRLLAQSRYLLMAADRQRFAQRVIAELRGIVHDNGHVPFWDHVINRFFSMEFDEADGLSATTDKQFILDLMPKYPIYVDLLPEAARAVIGQTHPDGQAAKKMLEWEGFVFDNHVDIFDGGPLVAVPRDMIRTIRESRQVTIEIGQAGGVDVLLSTDQLPAFKVTRLKGAVAGDKLTITAAEAEEMGLSQGSHARIWKVQP